jgi:hypothetical protein
VVLSCKVMVNIVMLSYIVVVRIDHYGSNVSRGKHRIKPV